MPKAIFSACKLWRGKVLGITSVGAQRSIIRLLGSGVICAEEVTAHPGGAFDRLWLPGPNPQRGMRRLCGLGDQADILEMVVLALIRERVLGPHAADDFDAFFQQRGALFAGNAIALELGRRIALSKTHVKATIGNDINGCGIFSHAHRIVQRQQQQKRPNPDPTGHGRHSAGNRQQGRRVAIFSKVMFGQPNGVITELFGYLCLFELLGIKLRLGFAPLGRIAKRK